ncbi:MAG TPA: hypothetical protein VIX91_09250 [Candidatus Acidoferrum sp.]
MLSFVSSKEAATRIFSARFLMSAALITIRVNHLENRECPSNLGNARKAESIASCKISSASATLPSKPCDANLMRRYPASMKLNQFKN